ncbi:MAG: hypothetical protein HY667_02025 [Chloroflexi bacterium]|nr:hypothetical protein [Chloroflexota bacterium]
MGRYANHEELGVNAPINYREDTTSESYNEGMSRIAPPGMKPRRVRGERFEERTDFNASVRWHREWDNAMFGGTEVERPGSEDKQKGLEGLIDHVKRRPRRA